MSTNPKTVEGIYRDGKVELLETPIDVDEARVIVTFLPEGAVNLSERGIDEAQAASPLATSPPRNILLMPTP